MSAPKRSNTRARTRKSGRPRPLPPEVNARNLAIEKQRREALNEKFLVLARSIPGLDTAQKLTKVLIVDESIRELERQRNLHMVAMQNLQDLLVDNTRLSMEVHNLRSQSLNFGTSSGDTSCFVNAGLQAMNSHAGFENNAPREADNVSGSTQSVSPNIMNTSLQSDYCHDMAQQSLQGGFDHYQTPLTFDQSAFNSYLGTDTSNGYTIEDYLFNQPIGL